MYCNQCGAQVPDHAKFCQTCGSAVGVEPSSTAAKIPCSEDIAVTAKEKRPKRKLSPRLKKLLTILGGVAAVILAAVLIVSAVREHKRTTILGEIPDPEIFFGVSGKHYHYDSSEYEHSIEFETEDVTKDMLDAYVDLLSSGEFPFVMDDGINDIFSSDRRWYLFRYNDSQELYDAAPNQIMVKYEPDYEQIFITIFNSGNFELVPVEPYNSDNTSYESTEQAPTPESEPEPQSEPEPEVQSSDPAVLPDFLETGTDYEVSSSTTSHMKVYTEDNMDISAVETYIQQLLDMGYAIVYTETYDFKGIDRRWELAHSGLDAETISENGAHVIVQSNTYTSWNDQTLSIEFSDGITMDGGDISISTPSTGGGYVDCPSCYGGNCTACNGRKGEYSYSPGLDREWEECWKCNGTGDCSRCGGDGQIFG